VCSCRAPLRPTMLALHLLHLQVDILQGPNRSTFAVIVIRLAIFWKGPVGPVRGPTRPADHSCKCPRTDLTQRVGLETSSTEITVLLIPYP